MTKNSNKIQLVHSRELVPRQEALEKAGEVFDEFTSSLWFADELIQLSDAAKFGFDQSEFTKLLSPDVIEHLANRRYLNTRLGRVPVGLLIKAQVAVNMVVPDGQDEGHLREPFVGENILPALHQEYVRQLEQQRLSEELGFGRIR